MTTSDRIPHDPLERVTRFFMGTSDVQLAAERLAQEFEELGIPYAICGGLAVFAHGHERMTKDVDVLLTADGLRRFQEQALGRGWLQRFPGSRGVRDTERNVPIDLIVSGGYPGNGTPRGVAFPDPATCWEQKHGKRFVTLPKLIELKLACGLSRPDRPGDFADVIQLIRANTLPETLADSLHPEVQPKYRELWGHAQLPTREF